MCPPESLISFGCFFMRLSLFSFFIMVSLCAFGQIVNTATMDTLETTVIGRLGIGGYIDAYWGYSTARSATGAIPYFVSSSRHNEMAINLAYLDLRYRAKNLRARVVPGFGTYMSANYAREPVGLRNLVEANVGVLLHAKRKIWLDAGILGSPYTNESAISKDHLMYTRSFAPEHVPYYLSGVRFSVPLSGNVNTYWYLLNGWQVIEDSNNRKAFGSQLEYRPNTAMLINWNTFIGDERSIENPDFRTRLFADLFWIFRPSEKWEATSCIFLGRQRRTGDLASNWWQANIIGRYHFSQRLSLAGRMEYFSDPDRVVAQRLFSGRSFSAFSSGFCLNLRLHEQALFRVEARQFFSPDKSLINSRNQPVANATWCVASLTAWF